MSRLIWMILFAHAKDVDFAMSGTEWDGKELKEVNLKTGDFVLNDGETIYEKYGKNAEMIKAVL